MKRIVAVSLALVFSVAFAALYASDAKPTMFHGVITDDMCGKNHMGGDAKSCTLKCVEKGAMFALYDPKADKVFALSDQAKAKEFAAEHVVVSGTLSEDGKTITVTQIQKGEGKKPS
ncbi:MAG TPA: hypothetical protein VFG76_12310 [Candidatus Polarisedimenticolia bacterium]|nr:hypothetical protein [Candidatus Polarisedimenticolia bacterium]